MTVASWQRALDEFEAAIEGHRATLAGRAGAPGAAFVPAAGLGPLPAELLPRALELAQACAQLTAELQAARDRARDSIGQLGQPTRSPGPAFLNTQA